MISARSSLRRAVAAVILAAAMPGAAGADDLLSVWRAAQANDPVLASAQAQRQAGIARQGQGRALFMPQIVMSGSAGVGVLDRDTRGAQFNAPGFGSANDAQFRSKVDGGPATALSVVLRQPILSEEKRAEASQMARQAQLAEAQWRAAQQDLILRVSQAYFAALVSEETLAVLQAQQRAARQALDVAAERFDAGATPVTDREEARARFDELTAQELLAANEVQVKRAALADLAGAPVQRLHRIRSDAVLDAAGIAPLAEWSSRTAQRNPLLAMQVLGGEIARDEMAKFRAKVSPSLDFVAQLTDERIGGNSGFGASRITSTAATVGVQLTIPLFTGGMREARREEAAALAERARFDTEALRRELLRQTHGAWLAVSSGAAQIHAQEQLLRSVQMRLEATETGQEVGARTMLDLVNAQADFYRVRRNLTQAKYQFLTDRLRLAAIAGELSEETLRTASDALAP